MKTLRLAAAVALDLTSFAVVGAAIGCIVLAVLALIGCAAPESIRREAALSSDTLELVKDSGAGPLDPAVTRAAAGSAEVARYVGSPVEALPLPTLGVPPSAESLNNLTEAYRAATQEESIREGVSVAADAIGTAEAAFGGAGLLGVALGLFRLVRWGILNAKAGKVFARAVEDFPDKVLKADVMKEAVKRGVAAVVHKIVRSETG